MKTSIRFLVIAVMLLSAWVYMLTHNDRPTPLPTPLSAFPTTIGDWRMVMDSQFDQKTLDILRPTDYMAKRFARTDGATADLYVGYHDGASQAGPLHSPKNCLPGSGWFEVSSERVRITTQDGVLDTVVAVYKHDASTELFIYWFQIGGTSISSEYALKVQEVFNSIKHGRRDTAFIRISVSMKGSKESAVAVAEEFLKAASQPIRQFLPS